MIDFAVRIVVLLNGIGNALGFPMLYPLGVIPESVGANEFAAVKTLQEDSSWIPAARGKAIKVVSLLLYHLPPTEQYLVIFMERNLGEVLLSQEATLMRNERTSLPRDEILEAYRIHLENLSRWLEARSNVSLLRVAYSAVIEEPRLQSQRIGGFLRIPLDVESMVDAVNPSLYRNRVR